eukprot:NODE_1737_length_859_cov_211.519753_g1368_i0.p1 GENE.NODE_1737_length_859_cov_211.519753_g1368_i0~~NODE_1737_length_859_cov_211.519753_g1368_i0.p1  ORF type:complete len:207 (-),score=89.03 NODE_1737_length_859_cov_211.519753_g1368_i0:238-801(-)
MSETELSQHNKHFLGAQYVKGYIPTSGDHELFEKLIGANPNTIAWLLKLAAHPTFDPYEAAVDDDDFDLFGDETEEEAATKKADDEAKSTTRIQNKHAGGKSSIVLDVKPWDDETDMKKLEEGVRAIEMDGLKWGASKLVDVAFGVKKLQIMLTIEDDKVGSDDLEEQITALEDYVQSMDIAVWNKL